MLFLAACAPRLQPLGPMPGSQPFLEDNYWNTDDGLRLRLRNWWPKNEDAERLRPKAAVIALHGFNDYSNAFAPSPGVPGLGPYLARQGMVTYAYDQRGFGATPHRGIWPGVKRMTKDLKDLSRLIRARHPDIPLVLLGESMGGAVIMAALAEADKPEADGAVLVAPAVWARQTMPPGHAIGLFFMAHSVPWMTATGRGLDIKPSDNIPMLQALGRDTLIIKETRFDAIWGLVNLMDAAFAAPENITLPLFLAMGGNDELVPSRPLQLAAARFPLMGQCQSQKVYEGGWHMLLRDLQAKQVLKDIAHWIDQLESRQEAPP